MIPALSIMLAVLAIVGALGGVWYIIRAAREVDALMQTLPPGFP